MPALRKLSVRRVFEFQRDCPTKPDEKKHVAPRLRCRPQPGVGRHRYGFQACFLKTATAGLTSVCLHARLDPNEGLGVDVERRPLPWSPVHPYVASRRPCLEPVRGRAGVGLTATAWEGEVEESAMDGLQIGWVASLPWPTRTASCDDTAKEGGRRRGRTEGSTVDGPAFSTSKSALFPAVGRTGQRIARCYSTVVIRIGTSFFSHLARAAYV